MDDRCLSAGAAGGRQRAGASRAPSVLVAVLSAAAVAVGCSGGGDAGEADAGGGIRADAGIDQDLVLHEGQVGRVIDLRDIARKGYAPDQVEIAFADHPEFDAALDVDPTTTLAILRIDNEALSEAQKADFAEGVAATIEVFADDDALLATYSGDSIALDDSNQPLVVTTEKPYLQRPLHLKEDMPYLLQPEDEDGVVTSVASDGYGVDEYVPESATQQFYFEPVEGEDTYTVRHLGYGEGEIWYLSSDYDFINLGGGSVDIPEEAPRHFIMEQDDEGWVRIRPVGTSGYLGLIGSELRVSDSDFDRFRLISDDVQWSVVDLGTSFHQPIVPPTELDFAYEGVIRNCSSAALTDTVGNASSRTNSVTAETSETFQLFSSETDTFEVGVGVGVEAGVKATANATQKFTYTTAATTTTRKTIKATSEETTEVSRVRELEVPPHTAVHVVDAVRSIRNVRVPFTQQLRVQGTSRNTGSALTGPEIASQLRFNFVSALPLAIEAGHVDVTIRGQVFVDQFFDVTTQADDIPGACD